MVAATIAVLSLASCTADSDSGALSGLVAKPPQHTLTGTVTLTGDVTGAWVATSDLSPICATGQVRIAIRGPSPGDIGYLSVNADGSILLDVEKYGDFAGTGGVFRASAGFTVNADIATLRGKHAHVSGTLSC